MENFDGLEYRIEEGDERPVVFIHGWLGSKEFWKLITPYLEGENEKTFYDQRCHGNSENGKFTMSSLAEDLRSLIEHLGLEDPVLVGHSMGGMTALQYAAQYDNFYSLVLLATSASTPDPENESVRYFLEKFDELSKGEWAEEITRNYVADSERQKIKDMTRKELRKADEKSIRYGLKAMMEYDVTAEFEDFDKPAVVVAGQKDGAITREKSEEAAELLNCELKVLETSHQMLPEKPEKVAEIVQNVVDKC